MMSKWAFPWFHSSAQKLEMMHNFIKAKPSSFKTVEHGSNHLAIGSLNDDVFVRHC